MVVNILYVDKNVLDVKILCEDKLFYVSCVYGNPTISLRHIVWERLSRFNLNRRSSWCMFGDFNEILNNSEKIGGPRKSDYTFQDFSNMIEICGMIELPSTGNSFTWGGRRSNLWIQSKLGRSFGNQRWFDQFPASNQAFLAKRGSDHRPILIKLISSQETYRGSFKFDKRMFRKPLVFETINQAWNSSSLNTNLCVASRIRSCRKALSKWKKDNQYNSSLKIPKLQEDLEYEQSSLNPSMFRLNSLTKALVCAYKEEENFWKQKSKDDWILYGDGNTKFFTPQLKSQGLGIRLLSYKMLMEFFKDLKLQKVK